MAAEALARLGYYDEVDGWVDANIHHRRHGPLPKRWQPINGESRDDWQEALGDRKRGGDWVELFRRELAETAWRQVLETWWPRMLPGCAGSLTHGLIRTAHAVRSLGAVDEPSKLQIDELARGLAFWATGYSAASAPAEMGKPTHMTTAAVDRALSELTAEYAGHYTATMPSPAGSADPHHHRAGRHATGPRRTACRPARGFHCTQWSASIAHSSPRSAGVRSTTSPAPAGPGAEPGNFAALAAQAVDIGDEHAIKICEAATREHALRPDPRYLTAAGTALRLIPHRAF